MASRESILRTLLQGEALVTLRPDQKEPQMIGPRSLYHRELIRIGWSMAKKLDADGVVFVLEYDDKLVARASAAATVETIQSFPGFHCEYCREAGIVWLHHTVEGWQSHLRAKHLSPRTGHTGPHLRRTVSRGLAIAGKHTTDQNQYRARADLEQVRREAARMLAEAD